MLLCSERKSNFWEAFLVGATRDFQERSDKIKTPKMPMEDVNAEMHLTCKESEQWSWLYEIRGIESHSVYGEI